MELIRNIVCHACKEKISPAYLDVSAPVISPPADVRFDNAVSDSTVICNSLSSPEPTEAFFSPPETPLAQSPEEPEVEKSPWSVKYNSEIEQMLKITFVHPFEYAPIKAYSVRFSPCGNFLAAGLRLGSTHIHDVNTRSMKWHVSVYDIALPCLTLLIVPWRNILATIRTNSIRPLYTACVSAQMVNIWLLEVHLRQFMLVYLDLAFRSVFLTKFPKIWKIVNKRVVAMFKGHKSTVASLDVSPDGRLLVTTSYDNSVRIWKMRDGSSKLLSLEGNTPTSVKFSPNGRHVAVSNVDGFLRILDVRSGRLVGKWKGHEHRIASLAFSPDGEKLVSGDWDGSMRCWDVSPLNVSGSSTERHVLEDGMLVMKNKTLEFNQQLVSLLFSDNTPLIAPHRESSALLPSPLTVNGWSMAHPTIAFVYGTCTRESGSAL